MSKTQKHRKHSKHLRKTKKERFSKSIKRDKRIIRKKKTRKMKGGFNNFPVTEIHNSDDLFNIKPGETYKFFGYKLSFYDFEIPNQQLFKEEIIKKSIQQTCRWQINNSYFKEKLSNARFLLTITYNDLTDGSEEIDSFIMANTMPENPDNDLYISLSCARENWSEKKNAAVKTSFGTILQCILLKYVKTIGFNDVYNSAAHYGLVNYYKRWGFRLHKNKCGMPDELTYKHELRISQGEDLTKAELEDVKKKAGYDMKLCGNDSTNICEYSRLQLAKVWKELEKFEDIYYSA